MACSWQQLGMRRDPSETEHAPQDACTRTREETGKRPLLLSLLCGGACFPIWLGGLHMRMLRVTTLLRECMGWFLVSYLWHADVQRVVLRPPALSDGYPLPELGCWSVASVATSDAVTSDQPPWELVAGRRQAPAHPQKRRPSMKSSLEWTLRRPPSSSGLSQKIWQPRWIQVWISRLVV